MKYVVPLMMSMGNIKAKAEPALVKNGYGWDLRTFCEENDVPQWKLFSSENEVWLEYEGILRQVPPGRKTTVTLGRSMGYQDHWNDWNVDYFYDESWGTLPKWEDGKIYWGGKSIKMTQAEKEQHRRELMAAFEHKEPEIKLPPNKQIPCDAHAPIEIPCDAHAPIEKTKKGSQKRDIEKQKQWHKENYYRPTLNILTEYKNKIQNYLQENDISISQLFLHLLEKEKII